MSWPVCVGISTTYSNREYDRFRHMARADSKTWIVFTAFALGLCALVAVLAAPASAYLFGPGKYCGVVVFDRWDACYLVSGPYVNYVASNAKSELVRYKGQAIQVDASEVTSGGLSPFLPDPMILRYQVLGPAPQPKWFTIDGLQLTVIPAFGRYTRPQFLIEIRNIGKSPVKIHRSSIGVLLFKAEKELPETYRSDDHSVALICRTGIEEASYTSSSRVGDQRTSWGYIVDTTTQPPASFVIAPRQSVRTRIRFKLYSGQYQFMFAYGDGVSSERTIVSNAISFDIGPDGQAIQVNQ
jgi:hypothetical protein